MRATMMTALALALFALSSCDRPATAPGQVRTLMDFSPYLTAQLTPAVARAQFGPPDEETGSGLRIYIYRLADGRRLLLGFPGDAPILYAKVQAPDGAMSDLALRP
jgi:hypothetical protein